MKTRYLYKTLLTLAAPLLVAACSDNGDDIPDPVGEDFEGIVINVPTRSSANQVGLDTGEGTVNDLTIIAYRQGKDSKGNAYAPLVKEVSDISALSTDEYETVPMSLPAATYHIYVVANVSPDDWTENNDKTWADLSETDLQNLEIKTEPSFNPKNLPMSCNYLAMRKEKSTSEKWGDVFTGGNITIERRTPTNVYADLTFAVAKVNYSIVNGKAKYLTMADKDKNGTDISATRVQFLNYAKYSSLMTHKEEIDEATEIEESGNVGGSGAYYEWLDDTYSDSTGPSDADAFAASKKLTDLSKLTTWCFRGTAYVPERLFKTMDDTEMSTDNPTKIKFNFSNEFYSKKAEMEFGGEIKIPSSQTGTEDHTHNGIIRGVLYEIKAFTTEKDIYLQVRVRPWQYEKYTFIL